jgi:regulator of replication initiation timing
MESFEGAEKFLTDLLEAIRQGRAAVELSKSLSAENARLKAENEKLQISNGHLQKEEVRRQKRDWAALVKKVDGAGAQLS